VGLELSLRCPYCNNDDDRVIDSRATDDGTAIRRRRACDQCNKRFTTYERVEGEEAMMVVKKDGRRQAFDRKKILHGMTVACEKRPVPMEELEAAANRIYHHLLSEGAREISSVEIGKRVMDELHRLDQVAYVRFASVYKQFKDLDEFMFELRRVISGADQKAAEHKIDNKIDKKPAEPQK
jgi:transcriptional repressor NrdR